MSISDNIDAKELELSLQAKTPQKGSYSRVGDQRVIFCWGFRAYIIAGQKFVSIFHGKNCEREK